MMEGLEKLINNIPGVVTRMRYENGLIVEYANDPLFDLMEMSREEFLERYENHYEKIILDADWENLKRNIEAAIEKEETVRGEYRIIHKGEQYEWRAMQAYVLEKHEKSAVLQCVISDITSMKYTQQELEKEREKLKAVIKMSGDMMFEYDIAADHMTYTNTGDGILFSRQITQNYTKSLSDIIKEEDAEVGYQLAETLRSGRENFVIELRRKGTDGEYHWVSVTGKTLYAKDGTPERVLGKIRNIDAQKEKEKELQEKSQKDSLTGLYNHMTAKNMAAKRIADMKPGEVSYLLVCDIDNFKKLNDTNGHMFGDAVICSFADEMSRLLPEAVRGRIGGDEFLIYVENTTREVVEKQMQELNILLSDRYNDEKNGLHISCSIGAVEIDGTIKDYNALFQLADNALYTVKDAGKGFCLIVDSRASEESQRTSYLNSERNRESYIRKDTLIKNDEELILLCVELLENVTNTTSALRLICDRTCRFFDLDDMVCVEHQEQGKEVLYQWNRTEKNEYTRRLYQEGVYEWDKLFGRCDDKGILVYREEDTRRVNTEGAKSLILNFSKEVSGYRGSIIYADRRNDRDWERERETLNRISNHIFTYMRQLREEERKREELDRKLNYDALTGLPVYNHFVALMEEYMAEHGKKGLYCVYTDFSNFQYLNEVYGYGAGDGVLQDYGKALQNEYDRNVCFCRVTSDHFLGMIKGENLEDAWQSYLDFTWNYTEKINQQFNQCNLVIASGMYEVKEDDFNVAVIMDNANEARKKCKEQRVATAVVAYTEEVKQEVEATKTIVANIVSAYNNQEFHAYLQPKVSLKSGKIVGAEALVRWIKPDGTIIMPSQFIDVSERNGFVTKIDFAVLDHVMEYLKEAIDLGEEVVPISVNFSRRHNEFSNFVPSIVKRLDNFNVPSCLLEAELTESVFMSDMSRLSSNAQALRDRGIQVSVDDFGSGYSSLNLLSRVTVDTIKLDRQFLQDTLNTAKGENALTIIKYLIRMLKRLGFKVLAEGVETEEQVKMLKNADCDVVQGYYFAKPMPIPEFREFLKKFNQEDV
ncbi:MAG: EAL domain-containing protein [Lachnospiraceae bacterium]|nr:EAL domain-containing protein [Lachnospiraceae bacterium]